MPPGNGVRVNGEILCVNIILQRLIIFIVNKLGNQYELFRIVSNSWENYFSLWAVRSENTNIIFRTVRMFAFTRADSLCARGKLPVDTAGVTGGQRV